MVTKTELKNRVAELLPTDVKDIGLLTPNALRVLHNRYLKKDGTGAVIETPREMFERVARHVADAETEPEKWFDPFFDMMWSLKFIPNSPTMMNAGRPLGMLSACFVLPLDDSIQDIMETARQIALVQRAGGGTGVDLSKLRPSGSIVASSGGTTEGPLSFLRMLSGVTNAIQQGAFRRGANMGTMRIDHPDVVSFIRVKEDLAQVTNYNLSVTMSDDFMARYKSDPDQVWAVKSPLDGAGAYLRKADGKADYATFEKGLSETARADYWTVGELFDLIIDKAWLSGEPGLIFIDRVNEHNQTPNVGEMTTTNPCGEQPLLPYEACNLGSINLAKFVNQDGTIDYADLRSTVRTAVRFLDNVVEVNNYPTPEIDQMCRANRKIGLGVMGWADLLYKCRVRYDSDEGLELARKIGNVIQKEAWDADTELAEEKGCFANWKGSTWDVKLGRKMRNAHTVTIAPTGTISIIAGCSGGIEPLFSLSFIRQVMDGETLYETNPIFGAELDGLGLSAEDKNNVLREACEHGTIAGVNTLPRDTREIFRSARDIAPMAHVRMQAAWQEYADAAVSKTINFPSDATPDQVKEAYLLAFETDCKGITVYRDGSRQNQPMALKKEVDAKKKRAAEDDPQSKIQIAPVRLPEIMTCLRVRQITSFGNMHVKISVDPKTGLEREVFAQLGKGGDIANSDLEAICRLLSLFLRCNGPLNLALRQLEGIGSSLTVPTASGRVTSLADGLSKAIQKYLHAKERHGLKALLLGEVDPSDLVNNEEEKAHANHSDRMSQTAFKVKCPECLGTLHFSEGCVKCPGCGYSQC